MPAYKFKTCIIDGQEQYAVSPVDCKDHPPETRSIQFPESLLSFVDIEMHTIAPLISDISDGVRCLSDEQRSTDIDKILHALDALADHHIYFEVFRQEWAGRIAQSQSAGPLQKRWQQGTRHMVEDLVGIQCQIKYLFSRVLDIDGEGGPVPEKMISYARTDSSFQFRPQTTHYEIWNDAAFAEVLYPEFMYDLISYHIQECVKRELRFRICKNCGRYFKLAQSLMTERTNANKEYRTLPLNTTGQSLLSGNIFCGHCGGRLTLTTNGKVYRQADGTPVKKKRIRYVCYNKTRHRRECDGQTGYTMHILDGVIETILHQVFDKMKCASSDMIVGGACQKQMALLRGDLQRVKAENTKANKEYESLKAEVLKAVQGQSALPMDVLNEVLSETRQRVLDTSRRLTELTMELENENAKVAEMQAEFNRIATWSEIFDSSDIATKKMICGYIIKQVTVMPFPLQSGQGTQSPSGFGLTEPG